MITKWIFSLANLLGPDPIPMRVDGPALMPFNGAVLPSSQREQFPLAAVQPSFEDGRTFALACLKLGETAFKGSGF